jgi:hypothetical protein
MERCGRLCRAIGNLESAVARDRLDRLPLDRPVFIAGIARSGSTILLETLARCPGVATHRYRDFPFLHFPIAWNAYLDLVPRRATPPVERAHLDGILVTPESPEAMEEILWMNFFPHLHDPERSNVLDESASHPAFERFLRDHIRKILLIRGGSRYVAKGNYNLTRLAYLHKIFPDVRFIVPVRHPISHAASLLKQHRLFTAVEGAVPEVSRHMRRVGHFEFGGNRTPVNAGDTALTRSIIGLWTQGEEARGLGRYWAALYGFADRLLAASQTLRRSTLVVRFEDLCLQPAATIQQMLEHCGLPEPSGGLAEAAARIAKPSYYRHDFTPEQVLAILEETAAVRRAYGYDDADPLEPSAAS